MKMNDRQLVHHVVCLSLISIVYTLLFSGHIVSAAGDFEPYEINGGLVSAVAGRNFVVVAADTRMVGPGGYLLKSRNYIANRLWGIQQNTLMEGLGEKLLHPKNNNDKAMDEGLSQELSLGYGSPVFIGSSGCGTDCQELQQVVRSDLRAASYRGQCSMSNPDQVARALSQILYSRRGFPFYTFCVLSGLDENDENGRVYEYDAIGSYEQVAVAVAGTGREALQPVLDRLFSCDLSSREKLVQGSADEAVHTLSRAYQSVSEREIGVGDKLVVHVTEKANDGSVSCRLRIIQLKEH